MIGRDEQAQLMNDALHKNKSSFLALTGRRRVGKTFLIDQVYANNFCLKVTGIQDATLQEQIINFTQKIQKHSKKRIAQPPQNWQQVFILLINYLETLPKNIKQVIFLDELPWICTHKSGFLKFLAHLWNDYLSKERHFILVICGSATSWITKKIINDKGGLHNRVTLQLQLKPFTLAETKAFLALKKIKFTNSAIVEIYMALGGIPFYLELLVNGESPAQAIQRLCFNDAAPLKNEYQNLYKAQFNNPENHEAIVTTLATSKNGLSRAVIINKAKITEGGPFTRSINDLILCGFVIEEQPFGKLKRGSVYRLVDEYSIFYHQFIKKNKTSSKGGWQLLAATQPYKTWAGYAFENICIKHTDQIKAALGIANVFTKTSSFTQNANNLTAGFQVDLVIDRNDNVIHLCECKFYNAPFEIDKKYATQLQIRKSLFMQNTGTNKTVFNTLITNYPMVSNPYALDSIDNSINIAQLM